MLTLTWCRLYRRADARDFECFSPSSTSIAICDHCCVTSLSVQSPDHQQFTFETNARIGSGYEVPRKMSKSLRRSGNVRVTPARGYRRRDPELSVRYL